MIITFIFQDVTVFLFFTVITRASMAIVSCRDILQTHFFWSNDLTTNELFLYDILLFFPNKVFISAFHYIESKEFVEK